MTASPTNANPGDLAPATGYLQVPLNLLTQSPRNVRTVEPDPEGLHALARNIASEGLLQNLTVVAKGGLFEVDAGGRRHRAMRMLVEQGVWSDDRLVPVHVINQESGVAASLAENHLREPMHPYDQFMAFSNLIASGRDLDEVAAAYGVSQAYVRQRMRLASLAPALLDDLRADTISVGVAEAFTLCDDHQRQLEVRAALASAPSFVRPADFVRANLTAGSVRDSDPRVRFLGLESIQSRRPEIVARDLFGDEIFVTDTAWLNAVVQEALEEQAAQLQATEGWGWSEAFLSPGDNNAAMLGRRREQPSSRDLTADELARLEAIEAEQETLRGQIDDADQEDDTPRAEALSDQWQELETESDEIHAARLSYTDEQKARSGVVLSLDHDGRVKCERGVLKADEAKTGAVSPPGKETSPVGRSSKDPAGTLSETLACELAAEHTAALRLSYAEQPKVALRALAHQLLLEVFHGHAAASHRISTVRCDTRECVIDHVSKTAASSPAAKAHAALLKKTQASLPPKAKLWPWLLDQSDDKVLSLLAIVTSTGITALRVGGSPRDGVGDLHQALGLNMADHWTPTAKNYFSRVKRSQIESAVKEAVDASSAANLPKRKSDAAAAAERLIAGKRWLPRPLRGPVSKQRKPATK